MYNKIQMIPTEKIFPNKFQPRRLFDAASITELAASICEIGLLAPLLVKKEDKGYMIVAGERRWRACKLCGFVQIPCIVCSFNNEETALAALIENLQRKELSPFEQAEAIKTLITTFSLTQAQAAARIGKSQSAVANKLRLLSLPLSVRQKIIEAGLSERHARELLRLSKDKQERALMHIIKKNLNVEQAQGYINSLLREKKGKKIMVFKDIRLFMNSIDRSIKILKTSGVDAISSREETASHIRYEIVIPKG